MHEANERIALLFERIGDMLEIKGENRFKIVAYRRAADALTGLPEDIGAVAERGELHKIPGIGKDLAAKIEEYLESGGLAYYERLSQEIPESLTDLLQIKGLGPKTLALFHEELGIDDIDSLEGALKAGKLSELTGIREKTLDNLKTGIALYRGGMERKRRGEVAPLIEGLREKIEGFPGVKRVEVAGSYRRGRETIGDVDILAESTKGEEIVQRFTVLPEARRVLASGETKGSIEIESDLQVDLRAVPPESFGAALQYFTGSKEHGVRLRNLAKRKGLKLSEYGVFRGERRVAGKDEAGVYKALGLPYIPPELREDRGEVEAALEGALPKKLVSIEDIQGDLHTHSDWSDGHATIAEMVRAAAEYGHKYLATTDHSVSSRIANGLPLERLEEKRKAVAKLAKSTKKIRLLMGAEVDIRKDGDLDYPDDVLRSLDVVVISVHSSMSQSRDKMTGRILDALDHPGVHILGHPTGRLIGEREGYEVDMDRILERAKERDVAVEVNGSWKRLDLNEVYARRAIEIGCRISINSDAHAPEAIPFMGFGVTQARRGWVERDRVINCWTWAKLKKWLEKKSAYWKKKP